MKYNCPYCDYATEDRRNWYYHKNGKKHKQLESEHKNKEINENKNDINVKKNHEIELLKEKLKASENEKKLIKEQLENTKGQLEETKKQYEKQIEAVNKQVELVNKHVETLEQQNQFQKQLINSAGGMIKKSMNTLSYLLLNYKNAPHICQLNDYSIISKDTGDLIKSLVHYHNKNKLNKYIGDFIIKQYKKEEPESQSMWSTDTDRLNYFICELLKEQNKKSKNGEK